MHVDTHPLFALDQVVTVRSVYTQEHQENKVPSFRRDT